MWSKFVNKIDTQECAYVHRHDLRYEFFQVLVQRWRAVPVRRSHFEISRQASRERGKYDEDGLSAGLPDFSFYNIPKREKYTKWPETTPNVCKKYQHPPLQEPPKICPKWDYWFENLSSGNPVLRGLCKQAVWPDRAKLNHFGTIITTS
jgi:hypothetical protein